ncbi:MAG: hypothetical protein HY321_03635 [Armatimonadetes bacterium]|nr:hypothetical protein [Armatimonadota bacterium]
MDRRGISLLGWLGGALGLVGLLLSGCANDSDVIAGGFTPGTRAIRAEVTVDGQPVSGVRVSITNGLQLTRLTDAQGVALFENVPEGTHFIRLTDFDAQRFNFPTTATPVTISDANPQVIVRFQGLPAANAVLTGAATINGQAPFQITGRPPVTLTLLPPSGNPVVANLEGTTGEFTFSGLLPGTYTLRLEFGGQVRATTITVPLGQRVVVNLEFANLPPG